MTQGKDEPCPSWLIEIIWHFAFTQSFRRYQNDSYPDTLCATQIDLVFSNIFAEWDSKQFREYLTAFNIPLKKKIKYYSKGMRRLFHLACALSHHPDLLVLDELTSGLDPIVRDNILDVLRDFVQDEKHAILLSTHYVQELECLADYITFIDNGIIVISEQKDTLLNNHAILLCNVTDIDEIDDSDVVACLKEDYGCKVLIRNGIAQQQKYHHYQFNNVTIQDMMLIYSKGERK